MIIKSKGLVIDWLLDQCLSFDFNVLMGKLFP